MLVAVLAAAPAATAATFEVDDPRDLVDAKPGDGACVTAEATCTLRAAIGEAGRRRGADAVVLPAGRFELRIPPPPRLAGSIAETTPATGDLDISEDLTLRGAGADRTVIDGGGLDRVLSTDYGVRSAVTDLTITGADATGAGTTLEIALGGAILNKGTMVVERVRLVGNVAHGGGGIFSVPQTHITVRDSLVARNTAVEGGGLRVDSGGLVVNSTITQNRLVTNPRGDLLPDEITGYGGGIDHRSGNDLTIIGSTISDNEAIKAGGGVTSGQGYVPLSEDLELGRVRLRNTIVAGNRSAKGPSDCHTSKVVLQSAGHNLDGDGSCKLTARSDLPRSDPRLGALAANGGPTETLALLPGSPAIDAAGTLCAATDQRGAARRGACDIGAYEYTPAAKATKKSRKAKKSRKGKRTKRRT